MKPQPFKALRLVCWHLLYRVPVLASPQEADERFACERVNLPWERWLEAKAGFPQLMAGVERKRALRRLWQECFGPPPDGWTPPDPRQPCSANFPAAALAHWRRRGIGNFSLGSYGERLEREYLMDEISSAQFGASKQAQANFSRATRARCIVSKPSRTGH